MVVVWMFIAGLFLQFFIVGLSIFVGPTWWGAHVAFGRRFGVITLVLLLLALAGRFPRGQVVLTALLIPLYVWQILLIELSGRFGVIVLSALHPVNAGIMLGLAIVLAHRAWKGIRAKAEMQAPQRPLLSTPGELGLLYQDVTFPSREDRLQLRGWLIPGILPSGALTLHRTIILVHGNSSNRADPVGGLLDLSRDLTHHGFAVLAFDLRGHGTSPPAPRSLGFFEQRDVLGAVDFLRTGSLPYPELGRPRHLGGWGVSMGAATLLLAAARETAIEAVISDCAYAEILPILEREIPKVSHLPAIFTPAILLAARVIYGIDFSAARPMDVVAHIAPRPICFIHGDADHYVPASHMDVLAKAASAGPASCVQTWLVPGADHGQSYRLQGNKYVSRLVTFFAAAFGPDPGDM